MMAGKSWRSMPASLEDKGDIEQAYGDSLSYFGDLESEISLTYLDSGFDKEEIHVKGPFKSPQPYIAMVLHCP